ENDELKQRLSELSTSEITFPSNLPPPDAAVDVRYTVHLVGQHSIRTTWKDMFLGGSELILSEQAEQEIARHAVTTLLNRSPLVTEVNPHDVTKVRTQLEALGLIRAISRTHPRGSIWITWLVTDKGRRYLIQEKAVKV